MYLEISVIDLFLLIVTILIISQYFKYHPLQLSYIDRRENAFNSFFIATHLCKSGARLKTS